MDNSVSQLEKVVKADPAVQNVIAYTGGGGATNGGTLYISLKPLGGQCEESATCLVRQTGAPEIINRLRPKLNRLPVARATLQAAQDLRIGGRSSAALYQYTIQSDNVQDLAHWGPLLCAGMQKLPGFQDVNTDAQNSGLQELLTYDRPTAARLGITPQSLDSSLYSAFGQSEVSIIYTQLNQYYVVMEVAPPYWQSPEGLKNIYLNTTGKGVIPLTAVSTAQATTTPLTVNHTSSFPSVTVSFNLAPGMSLSDAATRSEPDAAADEYAADRARIFCRNGGSLPNLAGQRADAHRLRRCWRSTLFWAYFMRAWCILLLSSPPCLRRAWERCWR